MSLLREDTLARWLVIPRAVIVACEPSDAVVEKGARFERIAEPSAESALEWAERIGSLRVLLAAPPAAAPVISSTIASVPDAGAPIAVAVFCCDAIDQTLLADTSTVRFVQLEALAAIVDGAWRHLVVVGGPPSVHHEIGELLARRVAPLSVLVVNAEAGVATYPHRALRLMPNDRDELLDAVTSAG